MKICDSDLGRKAGRPYEGIGFKVELPDASSWNKKLLMSGGFNFAGSFDDVGPDLLFGIGRGYATAATDAGHAGEAFADWLNRADGSAVNFEKTRNQASRGQAAHPGVLRYAERPHSGVSPKSPILHLCFEL